MSGVAGWLSFLIFALIVLGPLILIGSTASNFASTEVANPALFGLESWKLFKQAVWLTVFTEAGLRIYAGYLLWKVHVYESVKTSIKILWITGPIAAIFLNIILPKIIFDSVAFEEGLPEIIKATLSSVVWVFYLKKSIRVKNTYS
jgi:hypothetical protein